MEDVETTMWSTLVGAVDVRIGNFEFKCYISHLQEGPAYKEGEPFKLPDFTESGKHQLQVNRIDHPFEATTSAESVAKGLALLGTIIQERMENFKGDPTAYALIPCDEEDLENWPCGKLLDQLEDDLLSMAVELMDAQEEEVIAPDIAKSLHQIVHDSLETVAKVKKELDIEDD